VVIEFAGWVCPLTPLENRLREKGGALGYSGSFVEHYLEPLLYPAALTRGLQIAFGVFALVVNFGVYGYVIWPARLLPPGRIRRRRDRVLIRMSGGEFRSGYSEG
jgi:hypothetical protein